MPVEMMWEKNTKPNKLITLYAGIVLRMHPANERPCCNVMSSLTGWVHSQNDPCYGIILCHLYGYKDRM